MDFKEQNLAFHCASAIAEINQTDPDNFFTSYLFLDRPMFEAEAFIFLARAKLRESRKGEPRELGYAPGIETAVEVEERCLTRYIEGACFLREGMRRLRDIKDALPPERFWEGNRTRRKRSWANSLLGLGTGLEVHYAIKRGVPKDLVREHLVILSYRPQAFMMPALEAEIRDEAKRTAEERENPS